MARIGHGAVGEPFVELCISKKWQQNNCEKEKVFHWGFALCVEKGIGLGNRKIIKYLDWIYILKIGFPAWELLFFKVRNPRYRVNPLTWWSDILYICSMSRNYKFYNSEAAYFVSFAVVEWIDVFTTGE